MFWLEDSVRGIFSSHFKMPGASKKEEETEDYGYDLDTTGESGAINEGGEQAEFGM